MARKRKFLNYQVLIIFSLVGLAAGVVIFCFKRLHNSSPPPLIFASVVLAAKFDSHRPGNYYIWKCGGSQSYNLWQSFLFLLFLFTFVSLFALTFPQPQAHACSTSHK